LVVARLLFKDEKGQKKDLGDNEADNKDEEDEEAKPGLLSRMRAQAAMRTTTASTGDSNIPTRFPQIPHLRQT
jgi:hypothetical protein